VIIIIVVGYQGIGKSTLCNNKNISFKFIDLESSTFRGKNGIRPDDWYVYYVNVAIDLSKQNNIVFVSSHKEVRDLLKDTTENVVMVFPSLSLKEEWVNKLENRYKVTNSDKDYRAWKNALQCYEENINDLKSCGLPYIEIDSMNYSLEQLVINYEIGLISKKMKADNSEG
jgi:adenylate kinase family enzyme